MARHDMPFDMLRYPIEDTDLCACTFIRKGRMFVMINSALPLSKQIFAAAHELYHIYCYFEEHDSELLQSGSILASSIIDEEAKEIEDMEANAFAAILLAPKERLDEQTDVYNLSYKNISVQTILKVMDIFAIPYKAAVIRLLEEDKIEAKDAKKLLQVPEEEISKHMKLTGKAARWQEIHKDFVRFGSLSELMYDVEQMDAVRDERLTSDKSRLTEIMENLRKQ
ncbi:ImmA/IrrE family metallo-endopeptidase [Mediterraneibacter agrestimuris]|uniref:ImmA/IrrE family metallo-endopeptidase n=1 Tax=Mediterraneibacter agrestimuris TaxID=2941333 RepID=UPI002041492F|nr:ImmA/IrrE family metallo-endopeptidase [Mediterraneibacter agrestimuris]